MQYVLDSATQGSALVTLVLVDGQPAHQLVGFNTGTERDTWAHKVGNTQVDDATYDAIIAAKVA